MATSAANKALEQQRSRDLRLAASSTSPAGRAHDLAQARDLGGQIRANATAANQVAPSTAKTDTTAADLAAQNAADAAANQTNALKSASAQINAFLQSVPGLSQLDPNNELGKWMNGQTSSLYGSGITDPTAILGTLQTTMNNPEGDPAAKAVFDQIFPGYNDKINNKTSNSNGQYTGIGGYIQYANQIQSFANSAGLLPGTISASDIGNLWAGDTSASEVSTRLTTDYANAAQAWKNIPGFADHMQNYYGMDLSHLASYYINPTNTLNQINQQISAAQLGTQGANTGFGELSAAQASSLSAFLTNSGTNQLTTAEANKAFTGSLGGDINGSAAQLAAGGFEGTRPGQSSTGTVTQDQLLGAIQGNAADSAAVTQAQQARTAASRGGGGAVTTANGASGLGYAQ